MAARRTVTEAAADILVVNVGSTSLKLALVAPDERTRTLAALGEADPRAVLAVAHRVVHGGAEFTRPALIDGAVRERIHGVERLAPLHNGPALRGIDDAQAALPSVPHVAVFDTAFHASMPEPAAAYAVPAQWRAWGVRRYGFHGLSVAWSAERAPKLLGLPAGRSRLAVCHLGGAAR